MNVNRGSLFCDLALAERIERAEARHIADASTAARSRRRDADGFVVRLAGAVAAFAEPGSPLNKVAGLGFDGVPSAEALEEVEAAFAGHGAPTQVELCHLADPAVVAALVGRGYRLESFENVLGLALDPGRTATVPASMDVRQSEDLEPWLEVIAEGVAHPDTGGLPSNEEFPRGTLQNALRDLAAAGGRRYLARRDGVVAGGASFRAMDGIALLGGAATAPAHRRKGVQSALLSVRLADAAAAGCDLAVLTTQPASRSHQNAQRQGFDLLYTRAILIKPAGPAD